MNANSHLCMVVATDRNGAIGKENQLPWRHQQDMQYFKQLTTGHSVVMGSKTYRSMGFKPLKNRLNIVLTSKPEQFEPHPNLICVEGVREAIAVRMPSPPMKETRFIIGGASIYRQFLPYIDTISLSQLDLAIEGADTFLDDIDWDNWIPVSVVKHRIDEVFDGDCAWFSSVYTRRFHI